MPEAPEPPATQPRPAATTNDDLHRWLSEAMPGQFERLGPGQWRFFFEERPVVVVTDARAGRMRVISPVAQGPIEPDRMQRVLEANFGTALDARYALRDGVLWSAFIHPLPSLDRGEFYNGVAQVITLAETYGTTYSSSGLRFGPGANPPPDRAPGGLEV
ncbi:MAG: hypothetical protein AAF612_03270 [Planctomycetota bacterium]